MSKFLNFNRAYQKMKERGYSKLYILLDVHGTIISGSYTKFNEGREFYPDAKEVLQNMSRRKDLCLILWTSSHSEPIKDLVKWLSENEINIDYIGENPEMPSTELCDFSKKFAFDIILDDKADFHGETDWIFLKNKLKELDLWG